MPVALTWADGIRETGTGWRARLFSCEPGGAREGPGTGQSGGVSAALPPSPDKRPPFPEDSYRELIHRGHREVQEQPQNHVLRPRTWTPSPGRAPTASPWAPPSVRPVGSHLASPQNGKIHVGYKDLMENYQIVVSNLAAERGEKDPNLVLNLFQSLLDEFTRGYTKNDFEPPKVGAVPPRRAGLAEGWGAPRGPRGPHLCAPLSRAKPRRRSGSRNVL